ncbi:type IX secretion system membrane protein PorP/SprF [Meridianimaribacter flavus]|uniref:Type IX secretion system PorP/SprF family membrane protein n=1 Tax=Meridianimaribacter flavus TaxID=571115 RepID=A0ABY2G3H5_9FLAO|nr:type IX secretion system membrane protein PorP/SprF [Meridianimaribacter flavus]TDY11317.1 type IX secretion system PorP/SprF family membrane protein [Meridianimaribacter flavus]
MKLFVLVIALFICSTQMSYSQEDDGVVALALPVRNSLKFNRYVINPTFSFVREQNKYISLTNKREWVQFEDAPQTYLVSFSGRFKENIGIGVGVFQQNYGVLTTFGGLANFAYNVRLNTDNNLTFGLNVGAYKSGVNDGNVVTNFPDPSLDNIPSNFMLTVNPGINYGTAFLDFGISINNLVLYNLNSSQLIEDNPEQAIQAHMMYTGYMDSRGFFDESKFTGLLRSEFKKDKTVISGIAMVMVPKGIWAQVGYNTLYGGSAGLGLNITNQISIEYNFEKALGDLTDFGPSHEITLAYKFKNNTNFDYSSEDEVSALISPTRKIKPAVKLSKAEATERKLKAEAEEQARQEAEAKAKAAADAKAQAEAQQKAEEEARAKAAAEEQARQEAEAKAKAEAEAKAQAEAQQKAEEEARAKAAAEEQARQEAEAKAKAATEAKAQAEAQQKAEEEARAKAAEEEQARQEAEAKAKAEADAKAQVEAQQKAEEEARAKAAAEEQARQEAEAKAKAEAEAKAQQELEESQEDEVVDEEKDTPPEATDNLGKSMNEISESTEASKKEQEALLKKFLDAIDVKDQDLKDLKEENDLSEKGIYMEPKPFKSITAENAALEAIRTDLDNAIKTTSDKINELESLYNQRQQIETVAMDEVYLYYQKALKSLKAEQAAAIKAKSDLESRLEDINLATDFERKRRIKRALYDNEEDRYAQDKARLNSIKQNTPLSISPIPEEEFDFGEELSGNIQILKNVQNVENGYYLVVAVHTDVEKRDDFLAKAVASGEKNINFFYDVKTSKYYIYYESFESIQAANAALEAKESKPYKAKASLLKIEN